MDGPGSGMTTPPSVKKAADLLDRARRERSTTSQVLRSAAVRRDGPPRAPRAPRRPKGPIFGIVGRRTSAVSPGRPLKAPATASATATATATAARLVGRRRLPDGSRAPDHLNAARTAATRLHRCTPADEGSPSHHDAVAPGAPSKSRRPSARLRPRSQTTTSSADQVQPRFPVYFVTHDPVCPGSPETRCSLCDPFTPLRHPRREPPSQLPKSSLRCHPAVDRSHRCPDHRQSSRPSD